MQPRDTISPAFRNEDRPRALRSSETMAFDPDKHTVAYFIGRFHPIAEVEGERVVLRILPIYLADGQAIE